MPMKVVATIVESFWQAYRNLDEDLRRWGFTAVVRASEPLWSEEDVSRITCDADGYIVGLDRVTARVMDASPRLKCVSTYGVGYNQVDVTAATERGIVVCNAPGANAVAVAELTIGLMVALARHVVRADSMVKSGGWQLLMGSELAEKTIGIVGTGNVGREVARRANAFDMKALAYDEVEAKDARKMGVTYVPLERLLAESDFVTLHVPLTKTTRGLIGCRELSLMKPSAFVVNVARGGVVDEAALAEALASGRLAGAAVDVFENEPPPGSVLLSAPNVILTSHMGGSTREAVRRIAGCAVDNMTAALLAKAPQNVVNPDVLASANLRLARDAGDGSD